MPIHLAFAPGLEASDRHAALFEASLQRLRECGRLDELLRYYGVAPLD